MTLVFMCVYCARVYGYKIKMPQLTRVVSTAVSEMVAEYRVGFTQCECVIFNDVGIIYGLNDKFLMKP